MPINNAPKPMTTSPIFLKIGFFINKNITTPTNKITGATAVRLNETSCAVIVVPILAPKMIPTACANSIKPAFTKVTTITVVAPED